MSRCRPSQLSRIRGVAWLGAVLLSYGVSIAAAQEEAVVILGSADDPVAEAISLELAQRGFQASFSEPILDADPERRAAEAWTRAVVVGARAVVWIEASDDGSTVILRVMRARDARHDEAALVANHVAADARIAALVAAALTSELLAQPPEIAAVAPTNTDASPAPRDSSETSRPRPEHEALAEAEPFVRPYVTIVMDHSLRFAPLNGGLGARLAIGAEFVEGFRVGFHGRGFGIHEVKQDDTTFVSRMLPHALAGAELEMRISAWRLALTLGINAAIGASENINGLVAAWDFAAAVGGVAALGFLVGRGGDAVGIQLGLDAIIESNRVSSVGSLAVRWDFR